VSRLGDKDAILVYSVGGRGGRFGTARSAKIFGIVGRDSGYTAKHGDVVVVIPQIDPAWVTPLSVQTSWMWSALT
jgi:D-sedoheptulose 7-phosphate isomerase